MNENEQWRPVVGHEGAYEVSDQGRVRSLDRVVVRKDGRTMKKRGRILKPYKGDGFNHQAVGLQGRNRYVHHLVLEAFVGPRPDGYEGCHNDGDQLNNSLDNLRWDTPSGNQRDRLAHGTHHFARRTHCKWGHEYTPENTKWRLRTGPRYVKPSWIRVCLTCVRNRNKPATASESPETAA